MDRLQADKKIYHKTCFKCKHCKKTLTLANTLSAILQCFQLFKLANLTEFNVHRMQIHAYSIHIDCVWFLMGVNAHYNRLQCEQALTQSLTPLLAHSLDYYPSTYISSLSVPPGLVTMLPSRVSSTVSPTSQDSSSLSETMTVGLVVSLTRCSG